MPNFTAVTLKCGLIALEIGNFWYKFSPKGYIRLSNFYKIWLGGRSPTSTPTPSPLLLKNVGLQLPNSQKLAIFGINLAMISTVHRVWNSKITCISSTGWQFTSPTNSIIQRTHFINFVVFSDISRNLKVWSRGVKVPQFPYFSHRKCLQSTLLLTAYIIQLTLQNASSYSMLY